MKDYKRIKSLESPGSLHAKNISSQQITDLNTTEEGLTSEEASIRQKRDG